MIYIYIYRWFRTGSIINIFELAIWGYKPTNLPFWQSNVAIGTSPINRGFNGKSSANREHFPCHVWLPKGWLGGTWPLWLWSSQVWSEWWCHQKTGGGILIERGRSALRLSPSLKSKCEASQSIKVGDLLFDIYLIYKKNNIYKLLISACSKLATIWWLGHPQMWDG